MMHLSDLLLEHGASVVVWPQGEIRPAPLAAAERVQVERLAEAADGACADLADHARGLAALLRWAAGGPPAAPVDLAAAALLALELGRLVDAARVLQGNCGARLTMASLLA